MSETPFGVSVHQVELADAVVENAVEDLVSRLISQAGGHVGDALDRAVALGDVVRVAVGLRDGWAVAARRVQRRSWREIGSALGVSRQAASKRWGR